MRRLMLAFLTVVSTIAHADEIHPFQRDSIAQHLTDGVWTANLTGDDIAYNGFTRAQITVAEGQIYIAMPCATIVVPQAVVPDADPRVAPEPCIAIHTPAIDVASILSIATDFTVTTDGVILVDTERGGLTLHPDF